jgi:hypothetical protein
LVSVSGKLLLTLHYFGLQASCHSMFQENLTLYGGSVGLIKRKTYDSRNSGFTVYQCQTNSKYAAQVWD